MISDEMAAKVIEYLDKCIEKSPRAFKPSSYKNAYDFSDVLGKTISDAFRDIAGYNGEIFIDGLSADNLVDAVEYAIEHGLSIGHEMVTEFTSAVQQSTNDALGIGIKPVKAKVNRDRLSGLKEKFRSYEGMEEAEWILGAPVKNFIKNSVTENLKANADLLNAAGFDVTITRSLGPSGCCDWCKNLAGTYKMPNVSSDVFKAHDRCDCTIEVKTEKGAYFMRKSGHGFTRY